MTCALWLCAWEWFVLCGLCADFDCDPNPCQNGGTCFSEGGCSCPPGFNGVNCEMGTSNARTTSVFPHDVRLIRICSLITAVDVACLFLNATWSRRGRARRVNFQLMNSSWLTARSVTSTSLTMASMAPCVTTISRTSAAWLFVDSWDSSTSFSFLFFFCLILANLNY